MTKTRIEVNEQGDFYTIIPEDIIQELALEDGEVIEWVEEDGEVSLYFS